MEIRKRSVLIAISAIVCLSSPLKAETPAQEITRITETTAVLNARKAQLEAELKVLSAQSEIRKQRETTGPVDHPTLKSIEGVDGKFVASLLVAGGAAEDVKKGDKIHGGWTIVSIEANSVLIRRGKEQILLRLGNDSSVGSDARSASTSNGSIALPADH